MSFSRTPHRSESKTALPFRKVLQLAFAVVSLCAVSAGAARAATINVPAGGDFQAALNSAQPGDTITLAAGATFVGPFILPNKSGDGWITVRTSAPDASLPAEGVRVTPAYAGVMPKLASPGFNAPALHTAAGAHHFRFVGVEFKPVDSAALVTALVELGKGNSEQSTLDSVPHHLVFDRCYIHGDPAGTLVRGVALNSAHTEIVNSHVSDAKTAGRDTQAVCGWNGPGPFKIINNYLEGAGENVMFGGADPSIPNLVPSDIEIRRNHFYKPTAWRDVWTVKNLFELKNARRVVIDGNVFENNWLHAQSGYAILFTVRNQGGEAPWSTIEDVEFTNNVLRHTASAINILGRDYNFPSQQVARVTIKNNLFEDVSAARWGGQGTFLQITEARDVVVEHNTVLHSGNVTTAYGVPTTGFVFRNNLMAHNDGGIVGDAVGYGNRAISQYFPSAPIEKNLIAGAPDWVYPANNFYPSSLDAAGFVNRAGGDYRLAPSSPYRNAGTDGKDLGCDFDAMAAAQSGQGAQAATPTPTPTATPTPTPTPQPSYVSPGLVAAARAKAASLASSASAASAADINALSDDIERARLTFAGESGGFAAAAEIEMALRAALYFGRAAAALSAANAPVETVLDRLSVAELRLKQGEDSMLGRAPAAGAFNHAAAASTATIIGPADARSSASQALAALAPMSLATVAGDAARSPLALREELARPAAGGAFLYELGGASVSISGRAAQVLYVSGSRIDFVVPADLGAGEHELIVTSRDGMVSRGVVSVADVLPGLFTAAGTSEALAMNAVTFRGGGFDVTTPETLGADMQTRVTIFATGISNVWNPDASNDVREGERTRANVAESVAIQARTSDGRAFSLPVEFAGPSRSLRGLDQLTFRLIPELRGAGAVQLTLRANARESNTVTITVR